MNSLAKKSLKLSKAVYNAVNDAVTNPDQFLGAHQQPHQYNQQQSHYSQQQIPGQYPSQQPHQTGYGNNSYHNVPNPQAATGYSQPLYAAAQSPGYSGPYAAPSPPVNQQFPQSDAQLTGHIPTAPPVAGTPAPQSPWSPHPTSPALPSPPSTLGQSTQLYTPPMPPGTSQAFSPRPSHASPAPAISPPPSSPFSPPPLSSTAAFMSSLPPSQSYTPVNSGYSKPQPTPHTQNYSPQVGQSMPTSPPINHANSYPTSSNGPTSVSSLYAPHRNSSLSASSHQSDSEQPPTNFIAELSAESAMEPVELPAELPADFGLSKPTNGNNAAPAQEHKNSISPQISHSSPPQALNNGGGFESPESSPHAGLVPSNQASTGSVDSSLIPDSAVTPSETVQQPKPVHASSQSHSQPTSSVPHSPPQTQWQSPAPSPPINYQPVIYSQTPNPGSSSPIPSTPNQYFHPLSPPLNNGTPSPQNPPFDPRYTNPQVYAQQPQQLGQMGSLANKLQQTSLSAQPAAQPPFQYYPQGPVDQKILQAQMPAQQPFSNTFIHQQTSVNPNAPGYHPNGPPPPYIP